MKKSTPIVELYTERIVRQPPVSLDQLPCRCLVCDEVLVGDLAVQIHATLKGHWHCGTCNTSYSTKQDLLHHCRVKKCLPHACNYCGDKFSSYAALQRHCIRQHSAQVAALVKELQKAKAKSDITAGSTEPHLATETTASASAHKEDDTGKENSLFASSSSLSRSESGDEDLSDPSSYHIEELLCDSSEDELPASKTGTDREECLLSEDDFDLSSTESASVRIADSQEELLQELESFNLEIKCGLCCVTFNRVSDLKEHWPECPKRRMVESWLLTHWHLLWLMLRNFKRWFAHVFVTYVIRILVPLEDKKLSARPPLVPLSQLDTADEY